MGCGKCTPSSAPGLPQTTREPTLEARQAQALGVSHVGRLSPEKKGRERFLKELSKNGAGARGDLRSGEELAARRRALSPKRNRMRLHHLRQLSRHKRDLGRA